MPGSLADTEEFQIVTTIITLKSCPQVYTAETNLKEIHQQ